MGNKGRSERGFLGTIHHYDEHGRKTGTSRPGFLGGYNHYDSHGRPTGHSTPGFLGSYNHYDSHGRKTGHSDPGLFGGYTHRDANGRPAGHSDSGLFGGYHHSDSEGCYVATCVYGSYDCPQVWTLRRFRDHSLAQTAMGRAFIHTYYAISPTIVKWFGQTAWFQKLWRSVLDKMVQKLRDSGVKDTHQAVLPCVLQICD